MRVIFDTNILVLYLLGGGVSRIIIRTAFLDTLEKPFSFFYSPAMMDEYTDALYELPEDDPTVFFPENITNLLHYIELHGNLIYPTITLTTQDGNACTHEPDNRFLECAITAQADYLVTVNKRHFPTTYQNIQTVGPSEFRNILFSD